ncbi:unnamed protein product [Adineta steineri]|uniref:Uncharacterized protein n=1 Tax=Adineta steineri TaxID=433720 RepID=A0A819DD70_9BILA|nr:unnamed protein product [Adineta steineri]CAF3835606.1 unnamed protein product [Adineta steineri]
MTNTIDDIHLDFTLNYCQQITKQLLEIAQKFARKSRRPSTQLTCTDLINAFEFYLTMTTKKIVYYMRHFEALHNIEPYNFKLPDPELSPVGQTQSNAAIEIIKKIPSIDLIVCSPLTRTLQTYLLVFNDRRTVPLIIHPDLQEVCTEPCDMGSPLNDLKTKFPNLSNEFNTFEQTFGDIEWLNKIHPDNIYSPQQIEQRSKRFLDWLMNRSEKHIFVISHNLMLQKLLQNDNKQKIEFKNGEIKTIEY